VDEITPAGHIVWTYGPSSGPGALDRPSLAVRWPNGMIAVTDDWHHRIVVIDPKTKRIVWSYGHLGHPGTANGYLNKPDGLDLLPAGFTRSRRAARTTTARHANRAPRRTTAPASGHVYAVSRLPSAVSKASAVALRNGRLLVLGGLVAGTSSDQVLLGRPGHLRAAGRLPAPTHDAAAAEVGGAVYLFGGGQSVSTNSVVRIDPQTGRARTIAPLEEPLSDLGAAVVGGRAYLVGGYTGTQWATAVLRYGPRGETVIARLPAGLRYAGVAALGPTIYVAGGVTQAGNSRAVYAVRPHSVRRIATLPAPEAHAALASLGRYLYLFGGSRVLRIDPSNGSVTTAARLPVSLADPAAVTSGNRILIVGGGTDRIYAFSP
jgi:N-acetylneuraminic acid mutarotase